MMLGLVWDVFIDAVIIININSIGSISICITMIVISVSITIYNSIMIIMLTTMIAAVMTFLAWKTRTA